MNKEENKLNSETIMNKEENKITITFVDNIIKDYYDVESVELTDTMYIVKFVDKSILYLNANYAQLIYQGSNIGKDSNEERNVPPPIEPKKPELQTSLEDFKAPMPDNIKTVKNNNTERTTKIFEDIARLTKEAISTFIGDYNDETTRKLLVEKINHLLQDVKNNHTINIICDKSNNNDYYIANGGLRCYVDVDGGRITIEVLPQKYQIKVKNNSNE